MKQLTSLQKKNKILNNFLIKQVTILFPLSWALLLLLFFFGISCFSITQAFGSIYAHLD